MGQFYVAAKAFDVLERLDPNPEYWEGKRGSCVGLFQAIIAGHEPKFVFMFYFISLIGYFILIDPSENLFFYDSNLGPKQNDLKH